MNIVRKIRFWFKAKWLNLKLGLGNAWRKRPEVPNGFASSLFLRWWRGIILGLLLFVALYYPLGAAMVHHIDDNPDFKPAEVASNSSEAIAMMAALIDREVNQKTWVANLPFFFPASVLDNMPAYQMGIVSALSRFAVEVTDQLGRTRGSSQADRDLEDAAGLLKYSGKVWLINPETSWMFTASTNKQYRSARLKLLDYNARLAKGEAVFERRADNLQIVMDRIAKDLGSVSATLDQHIREHSKSMIDWNADEVFYSAKGKLYGYYMIIKALGGDFEGVIANKEATTAWKQMLDSLKEAALIQPLVVVNGEPDSQVLPSHLASQGFFLMRARTQLQETANILIK